MVLENFMLLAAITVRTQAYLQAMIESKLLPSFCLILSEKATSTAIKLETTKEEKAFFVPSKDLIILLEENNIPYEFAGTTDANCMSILNTLKARTQEFIIYSGYGGCILQKELFAIGKCFLHIHAGSLPQYRGSTTAYYSMIQEGNIGATAIIMNEKIDEGNILNQQKFPLPPSHINIDYIYEPWVRSRVLIQMLKDYVKQGQLCGKPQSINQGETYFIIHPVLKHISILSLWEEEV